MPRPRLLSRYPFTLDRAVLLATTAADGEPALVVMVVDRRGVLLAVRQLDLAAADVEEEVAAVVRILAKTRVGPPPEPVVLASVLPCFGTDAAAVVATWHEVRRQAAANGVELVDWLLVDDRGVASVRAAADRAAGGRRPA